MTDVAIQEQLTSALEDYLETIFELVRDHQIARIRDIAKARSVRPASVSPAMKRLADLGLIEYERREFITLTPSGERIARRIYARHQLLSRFFIDVLKVEKEIATSDACQMEHSISDRTMDGLARFIEFVESCDEGQELLSRFHQCSLVHPNILRCSHGDCVTSNCSKRQNRIENQQTIVDLSPGQNAKVTHVSGKGAIRQRLLDMGLLPGTDLQLERVAPLGEPLWIKLQGFQLSLRKDEAKAVVIERK